MAVDQKVIDDTCGMINKFWAEGHPADLYAENLMPGSAEDQVVWLDRQIAALETSGEASEGFDRAGLVALLSAIRERLGAAMRETSTE